MKQKFKKGDIVKIDSKMPNHMQHFPAGEFAVVGKSYYQEYGGKNENHHYGVFRLPSYSYIAWYYEDQLTLVDNKLIQLAVK